MIDPSDVVGSADRNSYPQIRWPRETWSQFGETIGPLRENLKLMPMGTDHHLEDLADVVLRKLLVEEVRHGIDKNEGRLLPVERLSEFHVNDANLAAPAWSAGGHAGEALEGLTRAGESGCDGLGIAILTFG